MKPSYREGEITLWYDSASTTDIRSRILAEELFKARVVQWNHRRYSLRLEPVFWRALEYQAAARAIRLNQLVGQIAQGADGGNLASHLRCYCLAQAERQAGEATLSPQRRDLLALFDQSPSPAVLLGENGAIRRLNARFAARFEGGDARFLGKSFLRTFRIQTGEPLSRVWHEFADGRQEPLPGRLAHIVKGRVTSASIKLQPIAARRPERFNIVVWIT